MSLDIDQVLTEQVVSMDVTNPDTSGKSRSFVFMGKIDRVESDDQRIVDWKCVTDPARFVRMKSIGFQVELYAAAIRARCQITEYVYRLIQIPTIRYCKKDPTADNYEKRCVDWLLERPERIFEHPFILTTSRILAARQWLWAKSQRILTNRRSGHWDTNELACYAWERECPYMPLCQCLASGGDPADMIADEYEKVDSHPELGDVGGSWGVLTYSSCLTHSLCEMKYYWRHEQCIRRQHDEGGESLRVGSAVHRGLEVCAEGGLAAAREAIAEWQETNPVLGEDANHKIDQECARARAIVAVAAERWL